MFLFWMGFIAGAVVIIVEIAILLVIIDKTGAWGVMP